MGREARLVRVRDTLLLDDLQVSEALIDEVRAPFTADETRHGDGLQHGCTRPACYKPVKGLDSPGAALSPYSGDRMFTGTLKRVYRTSYRCAGTCFWAGVFTTSRTQCSVALEM